MRYTAGDVLRRPVPDVVVAWWLDLPLRRNIRRRAWWSWLLFEKGQGWLRWGEDTRDGYHYDCPPEPYTVFPPLRRVYLTLRYRETWPLGFRDEDRRHHRAW